MAKASKKSKPAKSKSKPAATKKPQQKKVSSKRTESTPAAKPTPSRLSYTSQVKSITQKYSEEGIPKRVDIALKGIRKEIKAIMAPVYKLHSKIRDTTSRRQKAEYKKELALYEELLAPYIADLKEHRDDYKTLTKAKAIIRDQEKVAKRDLKKLEKKLKEADETKNYKELEKLTYEIVKLQGTIDAMGAALGKPIKMTDVEDYEPDLEEDEAGYIEDPNNPYTIWQAIKQLEEDQASGQFLWFIIDGARYSHKNVISIAVAASEFWLTLKKPKTDTPRVNRYVNLTTKSVKYKSYKS